MIYNKSYLNNSMSELESLGLESPKLNELNDSYEVGNLVDNLKQMLFVEYKSMPVFTDFKWSNTLTMEPDRSIFGCVIRALEDHLDKLKILLKF